MDETERRLLKVLRDALPTSLTTPVLAETLRVGRIRLAEALERLQREKKITRTYAGFRAIPEDVSAFDHMRRTRGDSWLADAACKGMDPKIFFPAEGAAPRDDFHPDAVETCAECPVADECLLTQMSWEASHYRGCARHNYYGGADPSERRKLAHNPGLLAIRIMAHRERLKEVA